ncbi:MAG: asparagine synthase (glutamine-hydrolyzing) [Chloroflexota bacterium]
MCGIAGFYGAPDTRLLHAMTDIIAHRGPAGAGHFESPEMSLGHRRLPIVDLGGRQQPFGNEDGRLQIAFDGEIFNYRELRGELRRLGHEFSTDADAEVVLHAYEEYGPECFARLNGMWAVAIADTAGQRLILARDHFGVRPLYYAQTRDRLLFASEIKALLQDPALRVEANNQMIYEYLVAGLHDHTPETFFKGVYRLPSAHYAIIDGGGMHLQHYWAPTLATTGDPSPERFRELLRKSVERRLGAEVPVGASLSGGIDSAGIVALMGGLANAQSSAGAGDGRVKTFSATSDGDPLDEGDCIAAQAALSGVDNAVTKPASDRFVTEFESLIWHQEEPMGSMAPYAQWEIMRLARQQVGVILDSQGGDELTAGGVPYQLVYLRQLRRQRRYLTFLREYWAARDVIRPFVRSQLRKANRVDPEALLRPEFAAEVKPPHDSRSQNDLKQRLLQDLLSYSLPAQLRYVDKNAMAFSLATRLPYLDQDLGEWLLTLPEAALINGGQSGAVVRAGLGDLLADGIRLRRVKASGVTPELRWMKARRAVFQSIVNSPAFQSRKYWDGKAIASELKAALEGRRVWSLFFWRAINVELWLRVFFEGADRQPGHGLSYIYAGDARAAELAGTTAASDLLAAAQPNPGKGLFLAVKDAIFGRVPVRTKLVEAGDDIVAVVRQALAGRERSGDIIAISEKIVAISQGRSFPVASIKPSKMARFLAHFVRKTPSGIGLGIPETMELAIREVGLARILIACGVTAVTRVFGLRGLFYRIVGPQAAAIDGPTPGTIPPYNTHAKLAPKDPDLVARKIAAALGGDIGVAIIDANDLGVNILGHTPDVDPDLVSKLFIDNPLGQGRQQTPIALLRRVSA